MKTPPPGEKKGDIHQQTLTIIWIAFLFSQALVGLRVWLPVLIQANYSPSHPNGSVEQTVFFVIGCCLAALSIVLPLLLKQFKSFSDLAPFKIMIIRAALAEGVAACAMIIGRAVVPILTIEYGLLVIAALCCLIVAFPKSKKP
jgi:hypothetical protein